MVTNSTSKAFEAELLWRAAAGCIPQVQHPPSGMYSTAALHLRLNARGNLFGPVPLGVLVP